jgi:hypothetical protein
MQKVDPKELDPERALNLNLRPFRKLIWPQAKEMWSTASILHAAQRDTYRKGSEWVARQTPPPGFEHIPAFEFVPVLLSLDGRGIPTSVQYGVRESNIKGFRPTGPDKYAEAMTGCLRELFRGFPGKGL